MITNELKMGFRAGIIALFPVIIFLWFNFGISLKLFLYSILFAVLVFSGIGELYERKTENIFILALMAVGGVLTVFEYGDDSFHITDSLSAMVLSGLSFLCMYFVTRGGLSLDNVILISFSGTIMGLQQIMGAMLVMSILAAFSSIIYMLLKLKKVKRSLPSLIYIYLGCVASLYSYSYSL